jgi:hypothetical protein
MSLFVFIPHSHSPTLILGGMRTLNKIIPYSIFFQFLTENSLPCSLFPCTPSLSLTLSLSLVPSLSLPDTEEGSLPFTPPSPPLLGISQRESLSLSLLPSLPPSVCPCIRACVRASLSLSLSPLSAPPPVSFSPVSFQGRHDPVTVRSLGHILSSRCGHVVVTARSRCHGAVTLSRRGHVVTARSRRGHVVVTARSRRGHVVTARSRRGHIVVTARSRRGHVVTARSRCHGAVTARSRRRCKTGWRPSTRTGTGGSRSTSSAGPRTGSCGPAAR